VSRAGSQQRTLLGLLGRLRPHLTTDPGLPGRIEALLSRDRRLGSRDRRLFRELIYTALRYLPWVEPLLDERPDEATRRIAWLAADLPAIQPFRAEVAAGLPPCPFPAEEKARVLGAAAADLNPAWLAAECAEALLPPLRDHLLARAPLWLRVQAADPAPILAELDELGWAWRRSPRAAAALELAPGTDITKTRAFRDGRVEVQDIGSQLVLAAARFPPAGHWLDACAGAGGKTLQLAGLLGPAGRVEARDVRPAALEELGRRAARAGLADRVVLGGGNPAGGFDGVLVDAPCSGSGTWRRSPHLRWFTTPAGVAAAARLQGSILAENAPLVRPGGFLIYATCSLCRTENELVVQKFLAGATGFAAVQPGLNLRPPDPDGDAFFVAVLKRAGPP